MKSIACTSANMREVFIKHISDLTEEDILTLLIDMVHSTNTICIYIILELYPSMHESLIQKMRLTSQVTQIVVSANYNVIKLLARLKIPICTNHQAIYPRNNAKYLIAVSKCIMEEKSVFETIVGISYGNDDVLSKCVPQFKLITFYNTRYKLYIHKWLFTQVMSYRLPKTFVAMLHAYGQGTIKNMFKYTFNKPFIPLHYDFMIFRMIPALYTTYEANRIYRNELYMLMYNQRNHFPMYDKYIHAIKNILNITEDDDHIMEVISTIRDNPTRKEMQIHRIKCSTWR
jgi:hypothetical protein